MFKKLRNKFLILNLIIITLVMLASFTSIYLITYNYVHRDINMELRKISEPNSKTNSPQKDMKPGFDNFEQSHGRSVSFSLITDSNYNIVSSNSIFDMSTDFYEAAKNAVMSENSRQGNFKLEDSDWTFIVNPYLNGYRIVFLDITSQQSILNNLIYTFLIVALVTLIAIFFISRFFANKSINPIKEAFDKQKQFIADASHELRTPLAVINTNVDVLLSNSEDSIKSQSKWLSYIKSEVERMTKLTSDLLYLTQMEYSDAKMIFSDFNLSETVENVVLTMEAVIFENNASLNYDIEPNLITQGNSEQIKQVVMILLDNALKYTNLPGTIDLILKNEHNNILLSVNNTGKGIPPELLDKVFDRFYRVDKSRSRNSGGHGLGLSIAKAIVSQHGGKIWASSVIDKSTSFNIEFPVIK
jgi:two-component system, OmpR family, sensor histidine kinase CiaH